jgi:very-short-patch-repair endonuclease
MERKKTGAEYRELSLQYATHTVTPQQQCVNKSANALLRKPKKKKKIKQKRPTQLGDYRLMNLQIRIKQSENHYIDKHEFAKMLFRRMTTEEKLILPELTALGFVPQQVVFGFIPDFWLPTKKIIVEIDGGYHTARKQLVADRERDEIFRRNEYKVLRFTNDEVSNNLKMVVEQIKKVVLV